MVGKFAAGMMIWAAIGLAEDPVRGKKLVGIHYRVDSHELCWDVMLGRFEDDKFVSEKLDEQPCIQFDKAEMTYGGETRGFDETEAQQALKLMEIVAKYAVDSSIWWDQGKGDRKGSNKIRAAIQRLVRRHHD